MLIAAPVNDGKLTGVIAAYLAVTIAYSLWLKHEPVIDLAAVAAGFVFRAIAGGVATGVTLSDWFLIVAGAGSLFMVTGKRHAEQVELGDASHGHRSTLADYSDAYLRYVRAVASGVMLTAYCLWAFENASATGDTTWFRLSIVPFVLAVLRYALVIEQGGGGAPEEVVLSDRVIQILGVLWIVLVRARRPWLTSPWTTTRAPSCSPDGAARLRLPPPSSRPTTSTTSTRCSRGPDAAGSSPAGSAGATATRRRTRAAPCSTDGLAD